MKKTVFVLLIAIFALSYNNVNSGTGNGDAPSQEPTEATSTSLNAEQTIVQFINELGEQNFQQAYELTENPKWGTFSDFSSEKSFGGISGTKILETKLSESNSETATVFSDVVYTDEINGTSQFQQNFYLQKFGTDRRITDMKVIKNDEQETAENDETILGVYTNGTVYLIVYTFDTGDDFKGVLLNTTNELVISGVYGEKTKTGYWFETVNNYKDYDSQRCDVDVTFDDDKVTLNNPDNCFDLNGTLTKTKDFTTPKPGNYGDLKINKVADYSITFKASLNEGSQSCTGEIGEEEYAVAYGIDGVYVFDNYDFEGEYGCLILITCKDKAITFLEIGMCAYHGANCSFDGEYIME